MTPAEQLVERTTRSSGVPYHVEDPATIGRVAGLITRATPPAIGTPGGVTEDRRAAGEPRPAA